MIKNKKQMYIIISVFTLILFIGGITYAWFVYRGESTNADLIAGDLYLTMTSGNETLTLTNALPETKEEARARDNNYITFNIFGKNTTNKTIYYEILLNYGADQASPKSRYTDSSLKFDLVELDSNGDEVRYLINNQSFDSINNQRIWVDTVNASTSSEIVKRYKLRVWLSEDVIISDTAANASYSTYDFPNKYATIKVAVSGDMEVKYARDYGKVLAAIEAKKTATTNSCDPTYVEDGITYFSGTNDCVDMNYVWYSGKLWRITALYPDGAMKLVTQNNITSIAFNSSASSDATKVNFYNSASDTSYMYQWLNEDFYDTLYNASNIIDTTKQWNATMPANTTISTKPAETTMVTANVGLLNSYEFYNSYRCVGVSGTHETCTGTSYSTGYLNIGYHWWLLNPYSTTSVRFVWESGFGSSYSPISKVGVRPSIVIKSRVKFTGNGTSANPYKIVGDKNTGSANDLINTRLSGEYVKLKSGNSEQLFRIIGVEDNKTKIIAMDYAENKNTRQFATSVEDGLWGSGTTIGADTWYTYLNTSITGYLDTLKSTYGELFDSGLYYLGTSGDCYILSVCANTTSGSTKVCTKTSDVGTFNIGLPRYGEMFATQQAGGSSNSINMWLINRYDESNICYLANNNYCGYKTSTNSYGIRPTVHLKSTVKILSGTGTETDPYIVGLPS